VETAEERSALAERVRQPPCDSLSKGQHHSSALNSSHLNGMTLHRTMAGNGKRSREKSLSRLHIALLAEA